MPGLADRESQKPAAPKDSLTWPAIENSVPMHYWFAKKATPPKLHGGAHLAVIRKLPSLLTRFRTYLSSLTPSAADFYANYLHGQAFCRGR